MVIVDTGYVGEEQLGVPAGLLAGLLVGIHQHRGLLDAKDLGGVQRHILAHQVFHGHQPGMRGRDLAADVRRQLAVLQGFPDDNVRVILADRIALDRNVALLFIGLPEDRQEPVTDRLDQLALENGNGLIVTGRFLDGFVQ